MSYAGPVRTRTGGKTASNKAADPASNHETDWEQIAIFGAGLALGLALGAGAALLTAPQAGVETRALIRRKAARTSLAMRRRGQDAWLDVRDELRSLQRAIGRRNARRAAEKDLDREVSERP